MSSPLALILLNKLSLPQAFLTVNQSDNSMLFVHINSQTEWQTVLILIRWLLKKPSDLDLHCFQRQCLSWFSRARVNISINLSKQSSTIKTSPLFKINPLSRTIFFRPKLFLPLFCVPLKRNHHWHCPKLVFKTTFGQCQMWSWYRNMVLFQFWLSLSSVNFLRMGLDFYLNLIHEKHM